MPRMVSKTCIFHFHNLIQLYGDKTYSKSIILTLYVRKWLCCAWKKVWLYKFSAILKQSPNFQVVAQLLQRFCISSHSKKKKCKIRVELIRNTCWICLKVVVALWKSRLCAKNIENLWSQFFFIDKYLPHRELFHSTKSMVGRRTVGEISTLH